MKKLFLFLIFISFSAIAQNKCADFKTGSFTYTDPRFSDTVVIRTDSIQTEIMRKDKLQITGSIEWISECKYELIFTKASQKKSENIIGKKITVEIVEITEHGYICESEMEGLKMRLEMIKIIAQ